VASLNSTYDKLSTAINLRTPDTDLSRLSTPSSMVRNEKQEIEIGTADQQPASIVSLRNIQIKQKLKMKINLRT